MAEEESGQKAAPEAPEAPEAKKGGKATKGKGKGPAGPAPVKGKSKGKEASAAPSWQKPEISAEWQVERMVNWQPIRQTSRLEGSVWQQVHDSLDGQAAHGLPQDLLERFMRKISEAPKRGSEVQKKVVTQTKRLLSSKQALVADIHHALLVRKGFRKVDDLTWILGPAQGDEEVPAEEVLEALQGLLGAAVGEERSLTAAGQATKDTVASEVFLRQLLERGPLQELQLRVQLNLDMARFNPKANDLESGLDLALTAAWSIIDSKAMPVLLEGILLLGNSVNAASKNLGGAVGVTLESLTKLAHTRCLPAKQAAGTKRKSSRVESALEVLTLHLDQASQGFISNLVSDLDACQSAKDFDHKLMASLVQELAEQVAQVQKHLRLHPESNAPCIQAQRLQSFLAKANGRIQHLQTCLEEIDEATLSLRQWFAEPPSSSLHDMLRVLAALRKLIPSPKQSDIPPPQDYRLSTTRKRRLEEKKAHPARETSDAAVTLQIPEGVVKTAEDPPEEAPEVKESEADLTEAKEAKEEMAQTAQVVDQSASQKVLPVGSICEAPPPSGVLPQILSWSKGTIWISWLFDWADVHRGFAEASAEKICAFEVLQFSSDCASLSQAELNSRPAASRWRCPTAPLKMDVPLGSHYVFGVRAILLKSGQLEDAEMLWASSVSSPVTLDLRYSTSSSSPSLPIAGGSAGSQENPLERSPKETSQEKSPNSSSPSPRRGRGASGPVASGIGEFLSGGSPSRRVSLRPFETASPGKSPKSLEVGGPDLGPFERDQAPSGHAKSQARESTGSGTPTAHQVEEPPVTMPESRESLAAEGSPASGQSPSSPQDLNDLKDLNDESLRLLMKACSVLETSRTSQSSRTFEPTQQSSGPPASGTSHAQPTVEPKEASHAIRTLSVPRARSIYEDDDFVNGMADKLSKSNVYLETHYEPGDPGDPEDLEVQAEAHAEDRAPAILDGEEVYARMQREFEQKCKACNGTGYVGWFGPQGWGFVQRKCRDCSK